MAMASPRWPGKRPSSRSLERKRMCPSISWALMRAAADCSEALKPEGPPGPAEEVVAHAAMAKLKQNRMARFIIRYSLCAALRAFSNSRSEEHTSELQSLRHLVCRL